MLQSKQQNFLKTVDSCGVSNLHGLPGLFGGLVAIFIVEGLNPKTQLIGIGITIVLSVLLGLITGKLISLFGRVKEAYSDAPEFENTEE